MKNKIPIEKSFLNPNLKDYIFEIGGGAVLLLWANTFSPFGINRQKRRIESPLHFLPNGKQINMSEDYTKVESDAEYRQREVNTMELSGSVVFAEYSTSLSIL